MLAHLRPLLLAGLLLSLPPPLLAEPLAIQQLTARESSAGLKEALTRGAEFAVTQLGQTDGFLGNPAVKIELPKSLQKVESLARKLGYGPQADELVTTMNRAAEAAVVEARPLLIKAIKNLTIADAHAILAGPPDTATQYFRRTTSAALSQKFQPIVKQATARVELAERYRAFAGRAARYQLIDAQDADLDSYITQKAMDGLYTLIAEQEQQIRQDPLGSGSKLLKKVFSAIGR
jgi:hypothetical protein